MMYAKKDELKMNVKMTVQGFELKISEFSFWWLLTKNVTNKVVGHYSGNLLES